MRSALAAIVLLATCLVASVATAANDKVTAQFEALAASGVIGEVTLNPMPNGTVQLRSSLRGLEPNTQYQVFVHDASTTCVDGTNAILVISFTSNPAGNANWNEKTSLQISSIQSVALRQQPANALVACATIPL